MPHGTHQTAPAATSATTACCSGSMLTAGASKKSPRKFAESLTASAPTDLTGDVSSRGAAARRVDAHGGAPHAGEERRREPSAAAAGSGELARM